MQPLPASAAKDGLPLAVRPVSAVAPPRAAAGPAHLQRLLPAPRPQLPPLPRPPRSPAAALQCPIDRARTPRCSARSVRVLRPRGPSPGQPDKLSGTVDSEYSSLDSAFDLFRAHDRTAEECPACIRPAVH